MRVQAPARTVAGMRVVVVGAGISGLAVALRMGRAGHDVTVVDRDPPPPATAADAFGGWRRRSVRQWQQYHVFKTRARRELERSAPDVLEALAAAGAPGAVRPESSAGADHGFRGLAVRRPVLEWVLRRAVEDCDDVTVLSPTAVASLVFDSRRRCATAVRTAEGAELPADLVVDAAGRRSPIRGWSEAAGFECPPPTRTDTGIAYYTRYYETLPDGGSRAAEVRGVEVVDDGFMAHALAIADSGTVGAIFVVPAHRPEFRALGSAAGWDAAVAEVARMAEVLDPSVRRPLMPPAAMYGLENAIVPWRADGLLGPRRVVPIGDSWLVTNPNLAWGSSIALAHAFALADAVDEHGPDVDAAIGAYRQRCSGEVEALFDEACRTDRSLQASWDLATPSRTATDIEREAIVFALMRLARQGDVEIARRLARRAELLDPQDALWQDEVLVASARRSLEERPFDPHRRSVTTDAERFLKAVHEATSTAQAGRVLA